MTGRVVDSATGNGISGVSVTIVEPNLFTVTDVRGDYRIADVPAGQQRVTFYKGGYQFSAIPDAAVEAGRTNRFDFALDPRAEMDTGDLIILDPIEVTATVTQDSQIGLINLRQKAINVSDAIGAESFAKFSLGDAADAMSRVPGASVVGGKYVLIRGLGDRYANTLINGVSVPSADPDKRAVQMDQFPTEIIESIQTSKSFTPDQQGSFSGGSVNIRTKSFPDNYFVTVSGSLGYNDRATGKEILSSPEGVDWLAMGADDRKPDALPVFQDMTVAAADRTSVNLSGLYATPSAVWRDIRNAANAGNLRPVEVLNDWANSFSHGFFPVTKTAGPNYGFSIATGDSIDMGDESLFGYTLSFTYDRSNSLVEDGIVGRVRPSNYAEDQLVDYRRIFSTDLSEYTYQDQLATADLPFDLGDFGYTKSEQDVTIGLFAKAAYKLNADHEVSLDIIRTQLATDEVSRGLGELGSDASDAYRVLESYSMLYTERSVTSLQLSGKSYFEALLESTIDWHVAWSESVQDQPDYRVVEALYNPYPPAHYETGSVFPASRFFRKLDETNKEYQVDWTMPTRLSESISGSLKIGGMFSQSERTYEEDQYAVSYGANADERSPAVSISDTDKNGNIVPGRGRDRLEDLYTDGTIGLIGYNEGNTTLPVELGWWPFLSNNFVSNYQGEQTVWGTYAMADLVAWESWRLIAGARAENTTIDVDTFNSAGELVYNSEIAREQGVEEAIRLAEAEEIDQVDILPGASLIYTISKQDGSDMNVRLAYGRTIARPTFKELMDSRIVDPFTDVPYQGDPDLELTTIDNFDLRWEWFLDRGQLIAVSTFYKQMENPIEVLVQNDPVFAGVVRPQNVEEGTVYGVELEWRYELGNLFEALEGLSVGGNASYVDSEVSIPPDELAFERLGDPDFADTRPLLGQSDYIFNFDLSYTNYDIGTSATVAVNHVGERLSLVTIGTLEDVYERPATQVDVIVSQRLVRGWKMKVAAKNLLDPVHEQTIQHGDQTLVWERYKRGRTYSISFTYDFASN